MADRVESDSEYATATSSPRLVGGFGRFELEVLDGPSTGARFPVDASQPSRVYLGKSRLSEICLEDPEVSRRHLALEVTDTALHAVDMSSTNGTFVNGVRIVEALLVGNETITVGSTRLLVHADPVPVAPKLHPAPRFGRVVGASPEMRRLYPLLARLSTSDVPVIIEGETGTGKELLAESIHEQGKRAQRPFVVFDCTAVPPSLVESALFGHEKGAFTGAVGPRKGVFEQAHGGTLLIDEIGDLAYDLQAKLLRAVERHEVQRVGGTSWLKVDVRVLCATRRDLEREIQEGRFRDDLYYRLAVARIELPPLRRRGADVTLLAEYFWRTLGGGETPVPADFLARIDGYAWPGNIRELHNAVVHRLALGDLAELEGLWRRIDAPSAPAASAPATVEPSSRPPALESVPAPVTPTGGGADIIAAILEEALPFPMAREKILRDFERRYVEWIVERHNGNMTKAAAASGMARRSLYAIKSRAAK